MTPETAVSLALWTLFHRSGRGASIGYREDVMDVLLHIRSAGIPVGGLGFKATPEGIESDEVAAFIGRLSMGGYLIQESPIRLTSYGIDLLSTEISDHMGEPEVTRAMELLGLTARDLNAENVARA